MAFILLISNLDMLTQLKKHYPSNPDFSQPSALFPKEVCTYIKTFLEIQRKRNPVYAAKQIQFWYRRTRDENRALCMLEDRNSSVLAKNIEERRNSMHY